MCICFPTLLIILFFLQTIDFFNNVFVLFCYVILCFFLFSFIAVVVVFVFHFCSSYPPYLHVVFINSSNPRGYGGPIYAPLSTPTDVGDISVSLYSVRTGGGGEGGYSQGPKYNLGYSWYIVIMRNIIDTNLSRR